MADKLINTYIRNLPSKIDRAAHIIVLASGDPAGLKLFVCYEAIIRVPNDCTDEQRKELAEWVVCCGAKLPYRRAVTYFQDLEEGKYRR